MFEKIENLKSIVRVAVMAIALPTVVACTPGGKIVSSASNNAVITLGDSIFDDNNVIQTKLEEYAGQTFRKYTQTGGELTGNRLAMSVYDQYEQAKIDDANIDTIVMNGGGNDILLPVILDGDVYGCKSPRSDRTFIEQACRDLIDEVYIEAVNLLNSMAPDNVNNVIYLGYYYTTRGWLRAGHLKAAIDYATPLMEDACANSAVSCAFVDTRAHMKGYLIKNDGVHPNQEGSTLMADLIWPELQPLL